MAEDNVGAVGYKVRVSGDVNEFLKNMDAAQKAYQKFEGGIDKMVNRFEKAMDKLEKSNAKIAQSARQNGKSAQDSFKKIEKSITPSIGKLEDLEASYAKIRQAASRVGDTEGFAKVDRAMAAYKKQLNQGFESTSHMNEATSRLSREMNQVASETKKYESTMIRMEKSVGSAEREVQTLTARMRAFGASEKDITPLNDALKKYKQDLRAAGGDTVKVEQANQAYKNSINQVTSRMEENRKSIRGSSGDQSEFVKQMQNSTKAVQLALGPLSGVAARITAFTSLVKTNTVSIAAFTASITGLVVATNRIITVGIEYERQLLNLEASIKDTGREAATTVEEMDALSRAIASATLTSSTAARNAINVLMTFQGLTVDLFDDILLAAQGVASAFGGNLVASTRLLARAIEQPSNSLDSLRRVGIQLNAQQKELIKSFEQTGQVARAQAILMDRISVFQARATAEAQGLAGQLDAVGDNFQTLLETISQNISANERLTEVYKNVNEVLVSLIENQEIISTVIEGVSGVISVAGRTLEFLVKNIELVAAAFTGAFIAAVVKASLVIGRLTVQSKAMSLIFPSLATNIDNFSKKVTNMARGSRIASIALGGLLAAIGPIGIALGSAAAAYLIFNSRMTQSESAADKVRSAYDALAHSSSVATDEITNLADATGRANKEMVKQAEFTARSYERDLKIALTGAAAAWEQYYDTIQSAAPSRDRFGGVRPGENIDFKKAIAPFEQFSARVEEAFNKVNEGGKVSRQTIEDLKDAAVDLGLDISFIEMLDEINTLTIRGKEATEMYKDMTAAIREGTVDLPTLFRGMKEQFGDLIFNFEEFENRVRESQFLRVMKENENGVKAVTQQFESLISTQVSLFAETSKNREAVVAYRRELLRAMYEAIEGVEGLEEALHNLRTQEIQNIGEDIGRTFQLISAGSESARESLERTFEAQDLSSDWMEQIESAAVKTGSLETALEALDQAMIENGFNANINAAALASMGLESEELRAFVDSLASSYINMNSRLDDSTKSNKKKEKSIDSLVSKYESYTDVLDKFNFIQEKGIDRLDEFEKMKAQEQVIRDVDKAMSKLNDEAMQRFIEKTGIAVESGESLRDALIRVGQESERTKEKIENMTEAQSNLTSFFDANKSEVAQIAESYGKLIGDALMANRPDLVPRLEMMKEQEIEDYIEALEKQFETVMGTVGVSPIDFKKMLSGGEGIESTMAGIFSNMFEGGMDQFEIFQDSFSVMVQGIKDEFGSIPPSMAASIQEMQGQMQNLQMIAQVGDTFGKASEVVGASMEAMSAAGRESSKEYQALALIQATIAQALAISKIWGEHAANPIYAGVLTGLAAATIGAQIAAMQSFAEGGAVSGRGTSTSDSIPARLSDGEYVIKASAVDKYGTGFLNAINMGNFEGFSTGGMVGAPPIINSSGGNASVNVQIIDQSTGNKEFTTEESMSPEGVRQLRVMVRDAVKESIYRGEMDNTMSATYGSKRKGKKR